MPAKPTPHHFISPGILEWSLYCQDAKVILTSHAWAHDGKVVLIDPVMPDVPTFAAIEKLGKVVAIFLTSGNHERQASALRKMMAVPLATSAYAVPELTIKPDIIFDPGRSVCGLDPRPITGGGPGETALYSEETRALFLGDAVVNLEETGLSLLPAKYCSDPAKLPGSLSSLSQLKIEAVCFAHGEALTGKDSFKQILQLPAPK